MAYIIVDKWILKDRLFIKISVSRGLWYFSRRDGTKERQVSLFFLGWYEREAVKAKLLTLTLLWLNIQIGFGINYDTNT